MVDMQLNPMFKVYNQLIIVIIGEFSNGVFNFSDKHINNKFYQKVHGDCTGYIII